MFEHMLSGFKNVMVGGDEDATNIAEPSHPYYPRSLELPTYIVPTTSTAQLLTIFLSALVVISIISLLIIIPRKNVSPKHKGIFLWFVICGCIHSILECYFSVFHRTMPEDNGLLGQLWKEYALSDSRYLTSDSFVVNMEIITAFVWGPLSFLTAIAIYNSWPFRYVLQLIISVGQLYGCILYYKTTIFEGSPHCRPEAYYYWFYFFFMNILWIIVPLLLIIQSWIVLTNAVQEDVKRKNKKID